MKTLTITEAKKNLSKWLSAAARGEEIGIVSGATIIGLHPLEAQAKRWPDAMPVDREYIRKEYGMTPAQMAAALESLNARSQSGIRMGKAIIIEKPTLEKLEKAISDHARAHQPARRTAKKRKNRRTTRTA